MQDKNSPLPILAKPVNFGNPWHGTVKSTTLTIKANGATMDWPAITLPQFRTTYDPVNLITRGFWEADRYGFTSRVKFTGGTAAGVADVVSGRHWLDAALLSGPVRQLYGQDLGGWIWQRADGTRWLVESDLDELNPHLWTDVVTVNFTFKPLGKFTQSAPPPDETATFDITDHGQSEASPPPFYSIVGIDTPPSSDHYRRVWLTVVDVSSTGRYAIVEVASTEVWGGVINYEGDEPNHLPSSYERCVLAYLLFDLGAPDDSAPVPASVTVLKRRENIYGTNEMHYVSDLDDYRGRIMRACFDSSDAIVYFEFRVAVYSFNQIVAKWVRVNSAGTDLDSISITITDTSATSWQCLYLTKYENTFSLISGNVKIVKAWVWSNNLVGFLVGDGPSGTPVVYSGKLMTADGPVTVSNKPYISNKQAFGSYAPISALGPLSERVAFGEAEPICWV